MSDKMTAKRKEEAALRCDPSLLLNCRQYSWTEVMWRRAHRITSGADLIGAVLFSFLD